VYFIYGSHINRATVAAFKTTMRGYNGVNRAYIVVSATQVSQSPAVAYGTP